MSEHVEPPQPAAKPGRGWIWIVVVIAVVLGLVAGFLGGLLGRNLASPAPASAPEASASSAVADGSVCDATQVSESVLPAVVTISASNGSEGGVGTGEIIRDDGFIVTNNHVISVAADGGEIAVLYSSGETAPATLVGRDPRADIAVLKVDHPSALPTIEVGSSANVVVGQPVVALGAPLGLSGSVTAGIVSALGREVTVPGDGDETTILTGAIQTDAAINPGNSGGPLVDCDGLLIGINTAIATVPNEAGEAGGGSVGIGFAVPVDRAMSIVDQLISSGTATYPYFGVSVVAIPESAAADFGVEGGLYVASVVAGGPADEAGIRAGDIILAVDGEPATDPEALTAITLEAQVGDEVEIAYLRDGTPATTTVTLQEAPLG
ncbi:putative serine protease PepD [Agromyces hippuratus]|uniref:Putative serine protease PepD n=1 Tax=Agromyces hippuratus TaxID=286438 RepID=A0A852X1H1_9MICO|nr:trypsin-like peptidase domain-containing protein [Agromyces hippuratus]NYG19965.1 putative serine protease PepD [Agromyces hippuratus]